MIDKFIDKIFQERYQIQSLLGRQTGRRTFLAKDLQTQSRVVVKLLLFNPDFTWDDLKLFQREAETLRNLDHLAIPQYLDYFEVETEIGKGSALVQSYIEAKSLQEWVESGRSFTEIELKAISTQLLEVIQYLHSHLQPVIHRDIKPSNILLTDRSGNNPGTVYLVDFGSVQTVINSGTITVVGTYGYMPPEQFGGKTSPASDLYSLGATLIYLMTRMHPADLPTRRGIIQFEAHSQISPRLKAWIKCLIQPDLEQRFSTAEKALEILQNDDLPLNGFSNIKVRPQNNRIILKKTDQNLCITIPLFFKCIVIYIDQKYTTYTVTFLWIVVQRKVLLTKDVVKLEQLFDCINIRFKSDYFSIKLLNTIEAEWLLYELSNWLDLSIQTTYETAQPSHNDESNDKLIPENTFKYPNNNLVNSSNSLRTRQPSSIQCTIETCSDFIEVSAPAKTNSGCFVTLACFVLIVFSGAVGGAFGLVFCIVFIIAYSTNSNPTQNLTNDRIILQIDQNTARLYKNSYPDKSLKQSFTKAILKIEVVYYSPRKYNSTDYHVALKTGLRDQLLVGNRTHWLSEREAYWIALELGHWLKVPVTEKRVVIELSGYD